MDYRPHERITSGSKRIINRMSSQFEESFVKELNRKLNAIPKPAREGEA